MADRLGRTCTLALASGPFILGCVCADHTPWPAKPQGCAADPRLRLGVCAGWATPCSHRQRGGDALLRSTTELPSSL
jgi:hypothetical protein